MNARIALRSLACAALALVAPAQWASLEEARLYEIAGTFNGYGSSVDLDGSTAVVGVPNSSSAGGGRVHVYVRGAGAWTKQATLQALDDAPSNGFGFDVALDGDTLVIGANGAIVSGLNAAGAAYVFTRSGSSWSQQQKLVAFDPEQQAEFGYSVDVSGDTCAIGSPQSTTGASVFAGATYVFVRGGSTWTLQQRIVPIGNLYGARSGRAVALEGHRLLIGAPTWFDQPNNQLFAGSAYEWSRAGSTWSQTDVIVPNDANDGRQFASSVALDGQSAVFGAWAENQPGGLNVGTAYVFRRGAGGWAQEQELVAAGIDNTDHFGWSVGIAGTTVVVGAPRGASVADPGSGTVRLFEFDGASWNEELALLGSGTSNGDRLGSSVAIDGDLVAAGADFGDVPSGGTGGEAYVWSTAPPATQAYCTAKTNSLGCLPAIGSSGVASATSGLPFLVTAADVLNQKQGVLFYGFAPNAAPFQGGWLCVQPPTRRLPPQGSGGSPAGADCTGAYSLDFNARIASGADPALAGGIDVYLQWWMRDPQAASTTGLTAGLRARIE